MAEDLRVFWHVGFFVSIRVDAPIPKQETHLAKVVTRMNKPDQTMAQQVAEAARAFQHRQTGHSPSAVTAVLSDDTLVITLRQALSPAEITLAQTPKGAAQIQEYHRQLFASSAEELRKDIRRITGVAVHEAAVEVESTIGAVMHAFTSGTMVQVFRLNGSISAETWSGPGNKR